MVTGQQPDLLQFTQPVQVVHRITVVLRPDVGGRSTAIERRTK